MAPQASLAPRSGGRILVDQLLAHGVARAFCVPGESYLPVLDALHDVRDRLALVSCRHESGAAFMAEACGKLDGRPGVAFVTRGPGATNAAIAVHVAEQDSTPMLLFVGQVARAHLGRQAFQEVDYRRLFGELARHVEQVDRVEALPGAVARAFAIATGDRPGPVVVALPEDMLRERVVVADAQPLAVHRRAGAPAVVAAIHARLAGARRPLVLVGGSTWDAAACAALQRFAAAAALPVCTAFRRQDILDNDSDAYVGYLGLNADPRLWERVQAADCLLVLGARLDEPSTRGYGLFAPGWCERHLVHVHPGLGELGRNFPPALAVHADPGPVIGALAGGPPLDGRRWRAWRDAARADWLRFRQPAEARRRLDPAAIMAVLDAEFHGGAIVTLDAGNFTAWPQRCLRLRRPGRLLAAVNGAMGYGVPAAIGAALARPRQTVVGMVGDGGLLMTGNELATAVQYGAAPLLLVFNNGMYGTIRLHQERAYPGRVIGTELRNPDVVALARAFGAHAERVEHSAGFAGALRRARASRRVAVLELVLEPDLLLPEVSLASLAGAAGPV